MSLKSTKYGFLEQKYKNEVYSYSYYMLKNKMDAEDTTQEVMIKTWENINKFNFLAATSWMIKTTHNLCIDNLRKRKSKSYKEISLDDDYTEIVDNSQSLHDPVTKAHNSIMTEKIKNKIKELPENLRAVFVLYELQGMKYREISLSLDIPLNSVKVYLMRARRKLQEELKEYELQEVI